MKPDVLILKDNFIVSLDIALAFLDVDDGDSESYRVAQKLTECKIPFIFVSGKNRELLPDEFRQTPFVSNQSLPLTWCNSPNRSPAHSIESTMSKDTHSAISSLPTSEHS